MKLSLEPNVVAPQDVTAESLALGRWYDAQPAVRRLWGVRSSQELRVIVVIEPTLDNDDVYPVWLANTGTWARELHSTVGCTVQLELFLETPFEGVEIDAASVVIADLFWRDATLGYPGLQPA